MVGVHYVDHHIATGFGIHLAQPIFRDEWKENMTLEEGKKLLEKALLVLFYRDRSAINKIQVLNLQEVIWNKIVHIGKLPAETNRKNDYSVIDTS